MNDALRKAAQAVVDAVCDYDGLNAIGARVNELRAVLAKPVSAQREWVSPSESDIEEIRFGIPTKAVTQRDHELARAVDYFLRSKNHD